VLSHPFAPRARAVIFAPVVPRSTSAVLLLVITSACSADQIGASLPEPDGDAFARDVYPVLLRDCGSPTCHGASARFFHLVGPGRTRLSEEQDPLDPVTPQEILESYRRTRAMLERDSDELPLLLRKPLDQSVGGASHGGRDLYGRNVYRSREDPSYLVIARWATNGGAP
jgi:hypothetical protein